MRAGLAQVLRCMPGARDYTLNPETYTLLLLGRSWCEHHSRPQACLTGQRMLMGPRSSLAEAWHRRTDAPTRLGACKERGGSESRSSPDRFRV